MPQPGEVARRRGERLWRFALALYARPGVADTLIRLQDRAGRDVNLMLFCLWLGAVEGRRLDPAGLAAAEAAIRPFAAIAAQLRGLRRSLKRTPDGDLQALHRRILGLEIAAERGVQQCLNAAALRGPATDDPLAAAAANLALYLGREQSAPEADRLLQALAALTRRA